MSRTRAHVPAQTILPEHLRTGPRNHTAYDPDMPNLSAVEWRGVLKHYGRHPADSEELRVQNRERRAADHATLRKIVKDNQMADSALWSDHRRDVYGLPSW